MKTTKYIIVFTIVIALFSIGCKKQLIDKYNQNQAAIKKTSEIKAANGFNWATYHSIAVSFVPIPEDVRLATFRVVAPDGSNLFQKYHKASESLTFNLEVPNQYDSLIVSYGSFSKHFSTKSGLAELRLN
jgi:hypothetical protein